MSGWTWVLLGGALEIGFTVALKLQQQDPRYGIMFLACVILSFDFLSRALKTLPLSTAYAVWTGIGSAGAVIAGAVMFHEPLSLTRIVLLTLLILALVSLKLATPETRNAT